MKKQETKERYEQRGVSSSKTDVHNAIKKVDKGIFPNAFCKIIPDLLGGDENYCNIMHADGAGTKTALAYLYWKETGDMSVWEGVVQDSIVMNLDDLICVGATNVPILLSSSIGRNKHLIPGEVISAIINGAEKFIETLKKFGIEIKTTGGETADLGDLIRTIVIDNTVTCRMPIKDVIEVNIQPGDVIVGLSSTGRSTYEESYNSGMGSNGLTSARHDIFYSKYRKKYPETYDPNTDKDLIYCGKNDVNTRPWKNNSIVMGKFVLSPTRTYAPIVGEIQKIIPKSEIHGIIHCSGGGQTKVLNFAKNVQIIKNNLFKTPHLFSFIQEASQTPWKQMYKTFNMGHRMEFYVPSKEIADRIIEISAHFDVDAKIIGHVVNSKKTKLTIHSEHGTFTY